MNQKEETLLIADDHPIFRHGVRTILSEIPWLNVVGEAESGNSALTQIEYLKPDIVLLDLEMPGMDGLSVLREATKIRPDTRIVILTSYDDEAYLKQALKSGASGYVIKDEAGTDLLACLEAVRSGRTYISPTLGSRTPIAPVISGKEKNLLESLTEMERTILTGVAEFKTSKEIAQELNVSYRTVQNHRANICNKLDLKGPHQLMQFAKDNV